MKLQDEFNKYVGLIIKDPRRLTFDIDPEGQKIHDFANKNGLHLNFVKEGVEPEDPPFMCDVQTLHVFIGKKGVPKSKKSWGWRVQSMNIG